MLKKLVKYGNSTALVLEKPLLELMGMEEGSFVKISTIDGKSLTITPMPKNKTPLLNVYDQYLKNKAENTPEFESQVESIKEVLAPVFGRLSVKYNVNELVSKMVGNPGYVKEVAVLDEKYSDLTVPSKEYITALCVIRYKYCPELKAFDDEMKELTEQVERAYQKSE